jgi:hypothetical protein
MRITVVRLELLGEAKKVGERIGELLWLKLALLAEEELRDWWCVWLQVN